MCKLLYSVSASFRKRKRVPVEFRVLSGIFFFLAVIFTPFVFAEDSVRAIPLFNAANGMMENGMYEMAREEWEKFLTEFPDDSRGTAARHQLGVCLYQMRDYENAAKRFSEAAADKKFQLRGQTLYLQGLSYYELAKNASQSVPEGTAAGKTDAETKYGGVPAASPAGGLYQKAVTCFQAVSLEYAKSAYKTDADFYCAICLQQLGRLPEAQRLFSALTASKSTPRDQMLLSLFAGAEIALKLRQLPAVTQNLDQLLAFYKTSAEAANIPNTGAHAHLRLRALCLRANVLSQADKDNLQETERAYAAILADKEFLEADGSQGEDREKFTSLGVDFPGIYYNHAELLMRLRRYAESVKEFQNFRERFPESPLIIRAMYQQALAMRRENDAAKKAGTANKYEPTEILRLWEEAFSRPEISEDIPLCNSAGHQLILVYLEQNDAGRADQVFQKVSEINAGKKTALTSALEKDRADILATLSRNEEAVAIYKKLVTQYLNDAKVREFTAFCAYQVVFLYGKDQKFQEALDYAKSIMAMTAFSQMPEALRIAIQHEAAGSAYRLQKFDESGKYYTDLLTRFPKDQAAAQWTLLVAHGYQLSGKYAEVPKFLTAARRAGLTVPVAQIEAGHILAYSLVQMSLAAKTPQEKETLQKQAETIFSDTFRRFISAGGESYTRGDVLCYDYASFAFTQAKYKSCNEALAYILEKSPDSTILDKVYFLRGRSAVATQNAETAIESFRAIIEKYPGSPLMPDALLAASQCSLNAGKTEDAKRYAEQLQRDFPDDRLKDTRANVQAVVYMEAGDYDAALPAWEIVLNSTQPELKKLRLDALYGIGFCKMQKHDYAAAEQNFRTLLKENPQWPASDKVYYQLGWALLKQNRPDDAQEFFDTLTKKFPKSDLVRESVYQLAVNLYRTGKIVDAEKLFQGLIAENKDDAIAQNARLPLAWMFFKQKDYKKAKDFSLSVLASLDALEKENLPAHAETDSVENPSPLSPEMLANRAELQFLVGQCDYALLKWEESLEYLKTALNGGHLSESYQEDCLLALIKIYESRENWPEVESLCARYVGKYPGSPQRMLIQYKIALALFNQQKVEEAEERFAKIVEEDKGIHAARSLFMLGEVQFSRKDYTGAIKTFYQVIYGFEDEELQADALYETARCFESLGQKEKAISHFQQLIDKFPKSNKAGIAKKKVQKK